MAKLLKLTSWMELILFFFRMKTNTTGNKVTYLEYFPALIVSGGIHAYVPAADIRVVLYTSRANPKSEILSVLFLKSSCSSIVSLINTEMREKRQLIITIFKENYITKKSIILKNPKNIYQKTLLRLNMNSQLINEFDSNFTRFASFA